MYEGPFVVLKRVGELAYTLNLPKKWQIHNVIHVCNLKPYHEDPDPRRGEVPIAPVYVTQEYALKVEKVLQHEERRHRAKTRTTCYLIKWKNVAEPEWQEAAELWQFQKELDAYLEVGMSTRASTLSVWENVTDPFEAIE